MKFTIFSRMIERAHLPGDWRGRGGAPRRRCTGSQDAEMAGRGGGAEGRREEGRRARREGEEGRAAGGLLGNLSRDSQKAGFPCA